MADPLFVSTSGSTAPNPALRVLTEGAPTAPKTEPAISPELQKNYLEISRRDAAVRKRELDLAAKEKVVKALEAKYGNLDKLKGNPDEVLKTFGLTPDQILLAQLGKKAPTPKVEDQIKALEERIEADRKAREEGDKTSKEESQRQQILNFRSFVAREVSSKADKYPLVNVLKAHGEIADEMGVYFEKYGEEPTVDQIAEAAEEHFTDVLKKAGWIPPRGAGKPGEQSKQLFEAVNEPKAEPKNQEPAGKRPFSLQDRVRNVLSSVG